MKLTIPFRSAQLDTTMLSNTRALSRRTSRVPFYWSHNTLAVPKIIQILSDGGECEVSLECDGPVPRR